MTLYDMVNNVTVQGTVEVRLYDTHCEELGSKFFEDSGDLYTEEMSNLEEWEDYEVKYIYTVKGVRNYNVHGGVCTPTEFPVLVIELEKPDE